MIQDTFYKKVLRVQLRSRVLERPSEGLKYVPRRAAMSRQDEVVEPAEEQTENTQQQPVQHVCFDGLGHYGMLDGVPELNVRGHGVQKGWMLQMLREHNIRYDTVEGHDFVRQYILSIQVLPAIRDYPQGIQITQDEWSLGLMYWQNLANQELGTVGMIIGNLSLLSCRRRTG